MKNPRQITAVESLFDRWPGLVGFSVQEAGSLASEREWVRLDERLAVADVGLLDGMGHDEKLEMLGELAGALLELIAERPEAETLLRGRTFARTLH